MNTARTAVGAASLDGLLYAVGGECAMAESQDDTLYLRCTECYDPVLKQWFLKSDMCKARSFVAVAAVGGYLYAIGGSVFWLSWSLVFFWWVTREASAPSPADTWVQIGNDWAQMGNDSCDDWV